MRLEADGPALFWRDAAGSARELRYSDVRRATQRMANLAASLGVRPGDPVMVMLPRVPEWQQCVVGLLKAGALRLSEAIATGSLHIRPTR